MTGFFTYPNKNNLDTQCPRTNAAVAVNKKKKSEIRRKHEQDNNQHENSHIRTTFRTRRAHPRTQTQRPPCPAAGQRQTLATLPNQNETQAGTNVEKKKTGTIFGNFAGYTHGRWSRRLALVAVKMSGWMYEQTITLPRLQLTLIILMKILKTRMQAMVPRPRGLDAIMR